MVVTVNVTQEHINRGKKQDCALCPIALALSEQHPSISGICFRVGSFDLLVYDVMHRLADDSFLTGWNIEGIGLPVEARRFVCEFDGSGMRLHCKPFYFQLDIPEYYLSKKGTFKCPSLL